MPFRSWICTNNSKTMLLRIVHPGGHVELHDRPVTAAEIMWRYPRCCVAYPCVFQQPWAVVAPDTVLMLGQKFFVVPTSTIRKLQGLSPRSSASPASEIRNIQSSKEEEDDGMISTCCVFRNKSITKQSYIHKQHSRNKNNKSEVRNMNLNADAKNGDNCFACLFTGVMTKSNVSETKTSLSSAELGPSNTVIRKRALGLNGKGLPKKVWSSENWQPSLDSITEE